MLGYISQSSSLTIASEWKDNIGTLLAVTLQAYGSFLHNEPDRYIIPAYPPSTGGQESQYPEMSYTNDSVISLCDPIVKPATVCVIVRATSNLTGIQEASDVEYCFEFDVAGDIVPRRPNQAYIESWSHNGLALAVKGLYLVPDELAEPDKLILCLKPVGTNIDPTSPISTVTLGSEVFGERRATMTYTVPSSGYYNIAVLAKKVSTGGLSKKYNVKTIRVDNFAPDGVINLKATVLRGE